MGFESALALFSCLFRNLIISLGFDLKLICECESPTAEHLIQTVEHTNLGASAIQIA